MHISELYQNLQVTDNLSHTYFSRDGITKTESEPVLHEHILSLYINEVFTMNLVCIPEHLTELILGQLLTEGFIRSVQDIDTIHICEDGTCAKVSLKNAEKKQTSELKPVLPINWDPDWIFDLADHFAQGMPYHSQTFATHSCFLSMDGTLLFQCEDIGRHNALDKAIGYALRNGIDLQKCIVYSSGRVPTDMVTKAIRAGIPLFASKASPTIEAAKLAKKYNLTLICAARRDRMKLF